MAFGLSPKHIQNFAIADLDHKSAYIIAVEAAKELGWNIGFISATGFIAYTKFSMSSWSEEIQVSVEQENLLLKSMCTGNQLADWGKNKKNIEQFITAFQKIRQSLSSDDIDAKYRELEQNFVPQEEDMINKAPLSTKEKIGDFVAIFKPTKGYFVTPILLNLNLVIFILMVITGVSIWLPDNESLLLWGANFRPATLNGEGWRLLTSCFIHIGVLHLLMNMYALMYIGLLLEPYLGKTRFLAAYLLTGIAGSATSLYWHELTISAGASGAIFGLYGVFLAMLTTNLIEKSARQTLLTSIGVFVGYNLLNGLKGGIDNAAHIGGLISGLAMGYAFYPSLIKPELTKLKTVTIGAMAILVLSSSMVVLSTTSSDIVKYEEVMAQFSALEQKALEIYAMPEDTPNEKLISMIQDKGLTSWQESIKLLEGIDKLDLPKELQARNLKMKTYCKLRIKSYEAMYKFITADTESNRSEVESYDKQIQALIEELSKN